MIQAPSRAHARRWLLAGLLAAASIGWVGEGHSVAAAPAELISTGGGIPPTSSNFGASVSGDGNIVVFGNNLFNPSSVPSFVQAVYVRNRSAGTTTKVPDPPTPSGQAPGGNTFGVLSRDGCHVVFLGRILIDLPLDRWDVYSWNRCTGGAPVPIATTGLSGDFPSAGISVSADGRFVAYFAATASGGPPHIARVDTTTQIESVLVAVPPITSASSIDISDDGKFVAVGGQRSVGGAITNQVVGWTPPCAGTCQTEVISVGANGQPASGSNSNPSVSADGRFVAFSSDSPDIAGLAAFLPSQVYVRDRVTGVTKLVTDTPGQPVAGGAVFVGSPDITPDGSQVAVDESDNSETTNVWVARSTSGFFDTSVFDLVSYGVTGDPVGGSGPSMSSTGRFVAFSSGANDQLSGGVVPDGSTQIWLQSRPIALDATPTIDFGTVDVGGQSAPQNAVVTNTSVAVINISGVSSPSAPFFITANACDGVLAAGASCVVTMVFRPTIVGSASSSITVSGDGLSVSSSLVGTGRALPTAGSLTIAPPSANFGSLPTGSTSLAQTFTVTNPGQTAVALAGVSLNGAAANQFAAISNTCAGSLNSGASCAISVVAKVTRTGALSATLVALGNGGQSAQATLRVVGTTPTPVAQVFTPVLKLNPGVVSAGQVTGIIGSGFPPNIDVQLEFQNETPFTTVHTDAAGAFRFDFLILRNGIRIGGRQVFAVDQPQFSDVHAPLLIDLATYRPSGFSSPAITNGIRSLVNRGG